ncbi:2,3,4,5-tetrahydropyridine-2,6-dicarboxylate N-succinyltransferase [Spirochaetota bacterium]|nr:2,3,4,5-tetrahydropyridine-2,6-dicarboxylate N-succinyltransferase [Spirochaetota bacterium]
MMSTTLTTPYSLAIGLERSHVPKSAKKIPLDVYYPLILTAHDNLTDQDSKPTPEHTSKPTPSSLEYLYSALSSIDETIKNPDCETISISPVVIQSLIAKLTSSDSNHHTTSLKKILLNIASIITKTPAHINHSTSSYPDDPPYHHYNWIVSVIKTPATPPHSLQNIYHRLTLISKRLAYPHDLNLTNLFALLPNIAWCNQGPILAEDIESYRLSQALATPPLLITHVDKFPYLVNYHIPSGVRIADGARARLGAYLGEGSTIMPAGYVNFNAGTKGSAMIEGRISAGVTVAAQSDLGGGSSVMGTLSGGGKEQITIAAKCLIGANAGTGISLGFGTTIGAGVYVTAGSKVHLRTADNKPCDLNGTVVKDGENIVKALVLSGREKLLFYTESHTGKLICKPNPKSAELNPILHQNS